MMMYHHTKFGDRVQQQLRKYVDKYQINMNLHTEHSNLMCLQDTPTI